MRRISPSWNKILACTRWLFPSKLERIIEDPFTRLGGHQDGRNEGAEGYPEDSFQHSTEAWQRRMEKWTGVGTLKRKPCSLLFGNEINCLRHYSHYFSDRSRKKEKWNCTSRLLVSHTSPKPVTHSTFHGMIEILNFLYFSNSQIATVSTRKGSKICLSFMPHLPNWPFACCMFLLSILFAEYPD